MTDIQHLPVMIIYGYLTTALPDGFFCLLFTYHQCLIFSFLYILQDLLTLGNNVEMTADVQIVSNVDQENAGNPSFSAPFGFVWSGTPYSVDLGLVLDGTDATYSRNLVNYRPASPGVRSHWCRLT